MKARTVETLPELMQAAMKAKGIPNAERLARAMGNTSGTLVNHWLKRGKYPSDTAVMLLSKVLDVDPWRLRRARDLSRLLGKAPTFLDELRLVWSRRESVGEKNQPVTVFQTLEELPLINGRQLPTEYQRFRMDPGVTCGLMGPLYAVCDQTAQLADGEPVMIPVSDRRVVFAHFDRELHKGRTAYPVVAFLPKKKGR